MDIFLPEGSSGEDRRTSGGDETEHTNGKGVLFDEFSVNGNDTSREVIRYLVTLCMTPSPSSTPTSTHTLYFSSITA